MANPSSCRARIAYPNPGALNAVPVEAGAEPCPIQAGQTSTHTIELDNQRPNSIYHVQLLTESLFKKIALNGGVYQWLHTEAVISGGSYSKSHLMTAQSGSQGNSDEIQCTVKLYDATQRSGGNSFSGNKEKTTLIYGIDIK